MSGDGRLPAELEVAGLIRAVQNDGGHAAVLRKGDPHRGSLLLLIASRGALVGCYERTLSLDGAYEWRDSGPPAGADPQKVAHFLAQRARFDPDSWAVELDIPDPQRFIAELRRTG